MNLTRPLKELAREAREASKYNLTELNEIKRLELRVAKIEELLAKAGIAPLMEV